MFPPVCQGIVEMVRGGVTVDRGWSTNKVPVCYHLVISCTYIRNRVSVQFLCTSRKFKNYRQVEEHKQSKRAFVDYIDKDREKWREMKELDWRCSDAFNAYYERVLKGLSLMERSFLEGQLNKGNVYQEVESPAKKQKSSLHLIHSTCFDDFKKKCNDTLYSVVRELACEYYFYEDLSRVDVMNVNDRYRMFFLKKITQIRFQSKRDEELVKRARDRFDQDPERGLMKLDQLSLRSFDRHVPDVFKKQIGVLEAAFCEQKLYIAVRGIHLSLLLALFTLLKCKNIKADSLWIVKSDRDLDRIASKKYAVDFDSFMLKHDSV